MYLYLDLVNYIICIFICTFSLGSFSYQEHHHIDVGTLNNQDSMFVYPGLFAVVKSLLFDCKALGNQSPSENGNATFIILYTFLRR